MGRLKHFEEAKVWQSPRILVQDVYFACWRPSYRHDYAFCDQIRRTLISLASNIAERFGSPSHPGFCGYLAAARGSVAGVQARLPVGLGYISSSDFAALESRCKSMGHRLTDFM
jgi:four helix bundle protein